MDVSEITGIRLTSSTRAPSPISDLSAKIRDSVDFLLPEGIAGEGPRDGPVPFRDFETHSFRSASGTYRVEYQWQTLSFWMNFPKMA